MNRQRACECLAILTIGEVISEEKKRQHQGRTRAWIKRREEKGYFSNVVRDLKTENTGLQCNALNVMKIFKVILRVRRRFHNIVVVPCKRAQHLCPTLFLVTEQQKCWDLLCQKFKVYVTNAIVVVVAYSVACCRPKMLCPFAWASKRMPSKKNGVLINQVNTKLFPIMTERFS